MPETYQSYLLRLWVEQRDGKVEWHSQIDHIASGRRWSFDMRDKLLDFLRGQLADPLSKEEVEGS